MSNNYTFWKLISEHRIEIPIIQRDYAQGRDSSKSKDIRSTFVKQIKVALSDEKELHLNFVYGKINGIINATKLAENKAAIQSMLNAVQSYSKNLDLNIVCEIKDPENREEGIHQTSFIPLDGQQRLTTLFLLHWYLIPHSDEKNKMVMKNFSYRIRPSSKDFCTALVESEFTIDNTKSVSEQIRDSSWFFSYWEKDPTVRGMLRMIDEIHAQFKDETKEELQNYWERLTGNNNKFISFEFLDLDEYNLTDDLYIKMNARGKPLTPFENFKAWLMDFISDKKIDVDNKRWTLFIDTKWTDLFWDNKDEANMLIDEEYMRFFRNMAQIYYVQNENFKPEGKSDEDEQNRKKAKLLTTTKRKDGEYLFIPNHFFAELDVFSPKNLNEIFLIIDILTDNDRGLSKIEASIEDIEFFNGDKKKSLFKAFISGSMTYPDKARFYGMMLYLLKYNEDSFDEIKFKSWMRVVRNLIENTVTGIVSFTGAIRGLFKLSEHCDNIYGYLAKADSKNISGFYRLQIQEEIRKAKLIDKNTDWEKKLLTYENHGYFKGQINFLIDVSTENGQITTDRFEEYAQKCAAIFSHKLENKNDVIFEQALLTIGDYLVRVKSNKSFVRMNTPSDKPDQDWRTTVFRKDDKLSILKELLKEISVGNEIKEMEELIKKHSVSDWRKHFIDHPDTITYCSQRFIRWNSEHDIKLLGSSGTNHYHAELYSYSLFLDLKSCGKIDICPFKELKYHDVKSNSKKAHVLLDRFVRSKNYNYAIKIYYSYPDYIIELFNRENAGIEDDIKGVLKNEGFQDQTDNFTISIKDETKTKESLLNLCKELKNIVC